MLLRCDILLGCVISLKVILNINPKYEIKSWKLFYQMKVKNEINIHFVVESHKIIFEFHFNFTNHKK